jgi:hypothetical protein
VDDDTGGPQARIRRLEVTVAVLLVGWLGTLAWLTLGRPDRHDVLTTERLEVVEPDGRPAFVLANSERPARGTFDGRVLMEGREDERAMPNFIFFDGHGDEVGEMLFENRETGSGFSATRHLSLDGYKQDQTVTLFHRQDPGSTSAGLSITDRPEDRSLPETFGQLGLTPPFTPGEADSVVADALPDDPEARAERLRELFGVNRVFLGSSDRDEATLVLKDRAGRPRIVLGVPDHGDPYLRILDDDGQSVTELP